MFFVADSSSAPEQGFIVQQLIQPLLQLNDAKKELQLIQAHSDAINELRTNADYHYEIDLRHKTVRFFEENYNDKTGKFRKGKDLTEERYIPYLKSIQNNDENQTAQEE
jgi:hypothetical protein